MHSIFLFHSDLSCSSLSDLRDSEEVTKALKTAVGSKQVQYTFHTLLRIHTTEVRLLTLSGRAEHFLTRVNNYMALEVTFKHYHCVYN